MRLPNDENKLQVDKKTTRNEKFKKSLKMYNIIETVLYKMTASGNIKPRVTSKRHK